MSDYLPEEISKSFTEDLHIEEEAMMWDSLPSEILTNVFVRLPIKSIVTCTSVSKTWKSLIQNPDFISNHLHHSSQSNGHPLLLFRLCSQKLAKAISSMKWSEEEKEVYALHWDDNKDFNEYTRFDFPFHGQCHNGIFRVVGTCNGLVCLADDLYRYCYNFILWNPCVRKFVELPTPNITFRTHGGYDASVGFGFDSKTNDFKVARFVTLLDRDDEWGESPPEVEVYSLATGEWRMVTALPPIGALHGRDPEAFVNGALHWVALKRTDGNQFLNFIMVFDLGDEVFHEIALPKLSEDGNEYFVRAPIQAYGNSLALFQHTRNSLNIWVMKEYADASSWTKIVSLADQGLTEDIPRPFWRNDIPNATGFRKSGEVILEMCDGQLVSRHLESQEIKDLRITAYGYTFVDYYVESLVLLDKPNLSDTY